MDVRSSTCDSSPLIPLLHLTSPGTTNHPSPVLGTTLPVWSQARICSKARLGTRDTDDDVRLAAWVDVVAGLPWDETLLPEASEVEEES